MMFYKIEEEQAIDMLKALGFDGMQMDACLIRWKGKGFIGDPIQKLKNVAELGGDSRSAYPQLSDLRAIEKALDIMDELIQTYAHKFDVEVNEEKSIHLKAVNAIRKLSEHFR